MTDAKRAFDVIVSAVACAVIWPVGLGIACWITASDPGPVFFRQTRVGRYGREFTILKFRTMRVAAAGREITSADDDRITDVGRVLRRTKLDELPQLLNVLTGDMSLVGPRPEVPRYVAQWPTPERAEILSVRPGITDPGSIAFRHEEDELAAAADPETHYVEQILPRKVALYVDYVRHHSLLGDLGVIARTAVAVLR